MENSSMFTLNAKDMWKGLQMFVITAVLMSVGGVVLQANFDVFSADWIAILKNAVNVSVVSTFSYIIKNLLTGEEGRFFKD